MLQPNSLAFRLIASSALIACLMLVLAGFLLNGLFQQAVARNFDARLEAVLDELLANVTVDDTGTPQIPTALADTRFELADSGWYWQVMPPETIDAYDLLSQSLLKTQLNLEPAAGVVRDAKGFARFFTSDRKGQQLRVIELPYRLVGAKENYLLAVAGNFDELKSEVDAFRRILFIVLGLLGLGLLGAILAQVLYGLRPMKEMERKLNDIRAGKAKTLDGKFPSEMQPIANELNLLMQSNTEVIERARMQVGNLAHALKTPISVLTNEARDHKGSLSEIVTSQLQVMNEQVSLYLERARRAAQAQTLGSVCLVEPVVQSIARTLQRIHRDKSLEISVDVAENLRFRGEKPDLEEMVGNLLDNASKFAKHKVIATAKVEIINDARMWCIIVIDDDGQGLKPEQRATALRRGQRLDESKPGSGLGLNIVTETAAMYGGRVELSNAQIGGLRVTLWLPTVT